MALEQTAVVKDTGDLTIGELMGRRVRKIMSGSELLFAYELDKYANRMLGRRVSLSGCQILKNLLTGEDFSFVVNNGLDVGFVPQRNTLASYAVRSELYFTGTVDGVVFKEQSPERYVYDFDVNVFKNAVLHSYNRSMGYVSLFAYLVVKAYQEGNKVPELVIDQQNYAQLECEYVDLLILRDYGNKLLKGKVDIKMSPDVKIQPEWEALVTYNRQRGFMCREYTPAEKLRMLKKKFQVGDVVLLYTRTRGAKGKTINQLLSCYPAVIRGYDAHSVQLTYYPMIETELTHYLNLDFLEQQMENNKEFYSPEDYTRFTTCTETYDIYNLGIDLFTFIEEVFILTPFDDDGTFQYVKMADGSYEHIHMGTLDSIYAVFEDRGIDYNKERFLELYFAGKTPIWEEYRYNK